MIHREVWKGFDTLVVVLVGWMLWKERNNRVFKNAMKQAAQLASWIHEEGQQPTCRILFINVPVWVACLCWLKIFS
jgi:hypothetical protein